MGWESSHARPTQTELLSQDVAEVLRKQGGVSLVVDHSFFPKKVEEVRASMVGKNIPVVMHDLKEAQATGTTDQLVQELTSSEAPGVVLVLSECVSPEWYNGETPEFLQKVAKTKNVALMELLPWYLSESTALDAAHNVNSTARRGVTMVTNNKQLSARVTDLYLEEPHLVGLPIPLVRPQTLENYVKLIDGQPMYGKKAMIKAKSFDSKAMKSAAEFRAEEDRIQPEITPQQHLNKLLETAFPPTRKLTAMLAAVPLTIDVVDSIREQMVPEATEGDFAHLAFSGLLEYIKTPNGDLYDFVPGVRELLLDGGRISISIEAMSIAAHAFAKQLPKFANTFALLAKGKFADMSFDATTDVSVIEFAKVATAVWKRIDLRLLDTIARIEAQIQAHPSQKRKEVDHPLPEIDIKAIEKDHGVGFLKKISEINPLEFQTLEDLKKLDGFEIAFKALAVFLLNNSTQESTIEHKTIRESIFDSTEYPLTLLHWKDGNTTGHLLFQYEENSIKKDNPARVRLEVNAGNPNPLCVYDYSYRKIGREQEGNIFGGISNGTSREGFMLERRDWRTSIHTESGGSAQETSATMAATMKSAALMLVQRYQEVAGEQYLEGPSKNIT